MRQYKVYHLTKDARSRDPRSWMDAVAPSEWPSSDYEHVATMNILHGESESDFLNQVYQRTNSIHDIWTIANAPRIAWKLRQELRSTSVGDVIVACGSGKRALVVDVGFKTF